MGESIGEFEQLILFAVIRLDAGASAVTVRQEIEARTGRTISSGALYTALDRLESRGFLSSRLGEPTPERGGKRKRLYTIEPAGARALTRSYDAIRKMASGLNARLQALLP
jgi:PadR family transcriptional regulator, regulatory protein PadR